MKGNSDGREKRSRIGNDRCRRNCNQRKSTEVVEKASWNLVDREARNCGKGS